MQDIPGLGFAQGKRWTRYYVDYEYAFASGFRIQPRHFHVPSQEDFVNWRPNDRTS